MSTPGTSSLSPSEKDLHRIVAAIRELQQGRTNASGAVTLTHNGSATTTTVAAPACGPASGVWLFPQTANAAAVVATTYAKTADVTARQFIITHAATANADVTFWWICLG